ncbi:MAG: prephenate dehydrogenase/arogenate dehydrogenase family protein, partial [Methanoregulaceae archaeon]|nr:prephenate dehydrogenase/arogenate dehydrogenase family protein [Methanoregulaceae archaeon]
MLVGIIGGTGRMGTFFSKVFSDAGHSVLSAGRNTRVTAEDIARQCELVIVSVPISETVPVIDSIAPLLTEEQVLADLTSLKVMPVGAMLRSRAKVVGMHPMFGPSAASLLRQTVVVTPARCDAPTLERILDIFRDQGARITITTPDEHDRMMAVVQGLTHFVTLVMADTMRRVKTTPEETLPFMSPVYRMEMNLAGRLLSQDPGLYGDLLRLNPHVPPVLAACLESQSEIADSVTGGSETEFEGIFRMNSEYFGEYRDCALEETDYL